MTYQGSFPPGQIFNGQPQQAPQNNYTNYGNGYTNGSQQYQQGSYPTQPAPTVQQEHQQQQQPPAPPQTQYYAAQFQGYDGTAPSRPAPASVAPPVQYVDPSFLQQVPPVRAPYQIPPINQPVSQAQPAFVTSSPTLSEKPRPSPVPRPGSSLGRDSRRSSSASHVTKSPTVSNAVHVETLPLLVCVAEDCFSKAHESVRAVARSRNEASVAEYHKLIATGLACLEAALQSNKLWPRLEARLRLRYASILLEETENIDMAETTLTKALAVCDKHRFSDLKYCTQFLTSKVLFERNRKAALIAVDNHISDCENYKQTPWIYAFRFLKASSYLQSGSAADAHAIENLRKIASIAKQRRDHHVYAMASLLEGFAYLTAMKGDISVKVQSCLAQARSVQLNKSGRLPQIDVLSLMLDLACSMHQKGPAANAQKLSALQQRMDELKDSDKWDLNLTELLLPIAKQSGTTQTVSTDTRAIIRPGDDQHDYLVMSVFGKLQAYALGFTLNGLVALNRATTIGKSTEIWDESLRTLRDSPLAISAESLPEALKWSNWEIEFKGYIHSLIGFQSATLSDWGKVKDCIEAIKKLESTSELLDLLAQFLLGAFYQGVAQLDEALEVYANPRFDLDRIDKKGHIAEELSILAALNRLWIMDSPMHRNESTTAMLLERLEPLCVDHRDPEIKMAYNVALAALTQTTGSINQVKKHIQMALNGAQATSNTHCLSIALNVMRARLFENVVGEQALKSARAGVAQAKKSGNLLWMSVADGMLAQSHEMQGSHEEARITKMSGTAFANKAYARTQVPE